MTLPRVAIVDGIRTPFVKAGGIFTNTSAQELGRLAMRELLERTEIEPAIIDEVIFGNVAQPMDATNIARVIALNAGCPQITSAQTVQRNCASGMQSIATGFDLIQTGQAHVVVAGGTESMSNIPLIFPKSMSQFLEALARAKSPLQKLGTMSKFELKMLKPIIALLEGLKDPFCGLNMGQTAQILANEYHISREEQDAFALRSHQRASAANKNGRFAQEMTTVYLPKEKTSVDMDVGPRENQTMEALAKLKPFFDRKHGSVTVGNSCPITDGASALLLMSEEKVKQFKIEPLAWIRSYAFAGVDPRRMGLGPTVAAPIALRKAQTKMSSIGLVEINEAFAAQVLSVVKVFGNPKYAESIGIPYADELAPIDPEILNVNGGAIALGHPVGTSGNRIVLTLAKEMKLRDVSLGLASICIGGGQGGAMVIEKA
ncbi:MAG: thiolase family protein [Proteobacteria bacterium]|nr:thiolase family protein [Pseudomonadota bacterium]